MYSVTHIRNTRFGLVFCGMLGDMYYLCHIAKWYWGGDDDHKPVVVKHDEDEYSITVKRAFDMDPLIDYAYEEIDATPFSIVDLDMNSIPYTSLKIPYSVWACANGVILTNPITHSL